MSATGDSWSPARYERFAAEREQPFWDLLGLVDAAPGGRATDLGCGTGALTGELHRRTGVAETVGIDSSARMLERSASHAVDGVRFEQADIARYEPGGELDIVFSNAALHWLPDHRGLYARLRGWLRPGGQLAVQMPDNMQATTHRVAAEVGREPRFAPFLAGKDRRGELLAAEEYAVLLHELGFEHQTVQRRVYTHVLPGREDVVEWFRGSLLTEYERHMDPETFAAFLARYREVLLPRLDDRRPYLLPFPRLLMWGRLAPRRAA
jgi:trans-aconitate 2-methyltransferase